MGKTRIKLSKAGDKLQNKADLIGDQVMGRNSKKSGKHKNNKKNQVADSQQKAKPQEYENSDEYMELEKSLKQMGLKIKPVESDGNCFFRSAADQVEGFENFHDKVRQKVVDYMEQHEEDFKVFVEDEKFKTYCQDMRKQGSWADHLEIHAFAQAYKADVAVYHTNQPVFMIKCLSKAERTVHLAYEGDLHYDSIRRQDDKLWGTPKPILLQNSAPSGNNSGSSQDSQENSSTSSPTSSYSSQNDQPYRNMNSTQNTITQSESPQDPSSLGGSAKENTQLPSNTNTSVSDTQGSNKTSSDNLCEQNNFVVQNGKSQQGQQYKKYGQQQPARNKACPCGANKKYKDCCANKKLQQQNNATQEGYLNSDVTNAQQQLKVISI